MRTGKDIDKDLSQREKEVLKLIIKGLTNKEISCELGISLTTAIFHRNNICEKLGTRSVGKMTIYAVLAGIIDINDI
jgi:DNA-binding CsgD family transcriptional regulator